MSSSSLAEPVAVIYIYKQLRCVVGILILFYLYSPHFKLNYKDMSGLILLHNKLKKSC